jgi:hypothetical protein
MDNGVKEQTLPATKHDNHYLEQEVTTDGQENMEIEEGLTKNDDKNLDLTTACLLFLYHYHSNNISDTTKHFVSSRFSHCIIS